MRKSETNLINEKVLLYMVVVQLVGGLGNKLFQYAAARRLAYMQNTELKLDEITSLYGKVNGGYTNLEPFNIKAEFATPLEIIYAQRLSKSQNISQSIILRKKLQFLRNWVSGTYGFFSKKIFQLFASSRQEDLSWVTITQDPNAILDQQILMASGNIYLQGYWQNEKYFDDIEDIIRDDLKIIKKPNKKNSELIGIIGDTISVAIHIRRGDYVSVSESFKTHGICSLDYYKSCIQYMADKLKKPHFFVFSDDAHMLLADLLKPFPHTFVNHNSFDEAFEDLRLMSLCKHQIIANSSLSWWGAWLNANKDKIVCAPKKWIASNLPCAQETVPDQWIKFDN